jgi:hypothetical protein
MTDQSTTNDVRDNGATTEPSLPVAEQTPSVPADKPHGNTGNANRRRHGARGCLTLTKAAPGEGWLRQLVGLFRKRLESEVAAAHGSISLVHEGLILSACRAELCCKLVERWGRQAGRTEAERLKASSEALDYSERRDRAIERLLGKVPASSNSDADEWAALDRLRANGHASGPIGGVE